MKQAKGKLPHIKWNPDITCWEAYNFKGGSRPIIIAGEFERGFKIICKRLKQRHDAMMKRREDQEAARKWREQSREESDQQPNPLKGKRIRTEIDWYEFRSKHDLI